jgi:predicted PurR-regulated permease PerM
VVFGISVPVVLIVLVATFQVFLFVSDVLQEKNWYELSENIRDQLDIDRVTRALLPYVPEDMNEEQLKSKLVELRMEVQNNLQSGLILLVENTIGMANKAVGLLGSLASLAVSLLMLVIALYYFLADGPALLSTAENLIPVSVDYQRELRSRFYTVVRAVVTATFLAALGQGFATAVMLCCYYGFRHFIVVLILATFASMVPLFGTWLVWGPCVIWLALQGAWVPAVLFTLIGIAVIGTMDNLIRTYVLQSDAQLHPLLAFVSVLGGVQLMGLWGVFIAPIVAAILHALIVIFNTEITELSNERIEEKRHPPAVIPREETVAQLPKKASDPSPSEDDPTTEETVQE